jgi:hypothetical protein
MKICWLMGVRVLQQTPTKDMRNLSVKITSKNLIKEYGMVLWGGMAVWVGGVPFYICSTTYTTIYK